VAKRVGLQDLSAAKGYPRREASCSPRAFPKLDSTRPTSTVARVRDDTLTPPMGLN
jgi:hypothetical protein